VGLENIDTAIRLVEDAVRMAPDQGELYSNLASLQATSGQIAEAEASFRRAVEVAPDSASSHLPLGNFYWATKRFDLAEQAFLRAVELEPENLLAHRALATFYLGTGRAVRAERSLEFVAAHAPGVDHRLALADYYLVMGQQAEGLALLEELRQVDESAARAETRLAALTYAAGRRVEAKQAVEAVLERFPNTPPALLLKARFARTEGDHEQALQLATQAALAGDDYVQAWFMLAELHAEDGDYFQASEAYKRVLGANPFAAEAQLQLSRLLMAAGDVENSSMLLNRALRTMRADDRAQLTLIKALLERGSVATAESRLTELLDRFPDNPAVHTLMGALHFLKRNYGVSRQWYERALRENAASVDALSGLVGLDLAAGRPADAVSRVLVRLADAPADTPTRLLLARTYAATSDFGKAEQALRQAIETDPDSLEAYGMLGQLLYSQGRLEEGMGEFQNLLAIRPRSVPALTMVGIILRRQGRTDEAIEQYKRVLAIDAEAAVAANNLAWIYAERGTNLDEAILHARVAKRKLPDTPDVSDTLGWAYYRSGSPDGLKLAVPYLQEAVDGAPANPLFRYHYGAALARSGQTDAAKLQLQEALSLSSDFHGAAETRRILGALP
jgi:tetratricopeptide (TPR) repeat protein